MAGRRATIKDVAAKAGVGISVVSYVINNTPGKTISEATRERIFAAAKELEYTPNAIARGMRIKKAMTIGLVSFWNITDLVFIEILEGVSKGAEENGYSILLCNLNSKEDSLNYEELYKKQIIDGIILISPHDIRKGFDEKLHVETIKKNKIPSVIINGTTKDDDVSYIYFDYFNSTYKAVEYLVNKGHRWIGYLNTYGKEMNQIPAKERLQGYKKAMSDNGLSVIEQHIFNAEEVETLCDLVLKGQGPSALIANKSNYGHLFLKRAFERNIKIPEQISVMAANAESYSAYLFPALTTIHLPMKEIGQMAAEIMLDIIKGAMSQIKLTLPGQVEERESVKER